MNRAFIIWMVRRTSWMHRHALTNWPLDGRPAKKAAMRYMPFFPDEVQTGSNTIYRKLPRWAVCNALLHHWLSHNDGSHMHDHPRWSITVVLRGEITELTPWGEKVLRAGSIIFRRTKYIHGFRVKPEHSARTWTLFIVGRRKAMQNSYIVKRNTEAPDRSIKIAARNGRSA